jgi:hypothetical protein
MADELLLPSPGELADDENSDTTSDYGAFRDDTKVSVRLPSPTFSSFLEEDGRHFPLMKLPPEVRLNVYDCLFTDLTIERQHQVADLTVYHHPYEWPDNDFSDYRNLLLTCREVHDEAKGLWENMYIHHCCFYFWKVPDLYRVAKLLTDLGEPYQRMTYALRTRTGSETGPYTTEFIDDVSMDLMLKQSGFPEHDPDYYGFHWAWPQFNWAAGPGMHSLLTNRRVPYEIYVRNAETYARADFPGLEECSIAAHDWRHAVMHSYKQYLLMSGMIGDIAWDHYDPVTGHAKMMIWEEWDRSEYPSRSLVRSDIALTWRAQAMSGHDQAWLALGGDPEDLRSIGLFQDDYELEDWLTAERH